VTGWWARWVAHTSREVDSRPLRLVRALVAACLLGDLAAMAWRGALEAVLLPASAGGLGSEPSPQAWFAGAWWAGGLWYGVGWLALPWVFAGRAVRPALALALLASAQLGHLYVPGDRGIDRLLRTVLLVLLFSRATDDRPPVKVAAWPMDLLRWLLAIVYLQAGIAKLDAEPGFLDLHQPELYEILCEPAVGRLDPLTWRPVPWLFTAGGAVALALELSAPLLVTRWARWWAVGRRAPAPGAGGDDGAGHVPVRDAGPVPGVVVPVDRAGAGRAGAAAAAVARRLGPPGSASART
jgi:hypothetical protein